MSDSSHHLSSPVATARRGRWVAPCSLVAVIFLASSRSQVAAPNLVSHADKLIHAGAFGLLATLVLRVFFDAQRPWRSVVLAAAGASIYGVLDEFRQSFTPGRSVEVADWIADTTGAFVAVLAYAFWGGWRRFLETPVRRSASLVPGRTGGTAR